MAISADAMQWGFAPLLFEGFLSPFNIALDVFMCASCVALLGFNVAFLPSFVFEMVPLLDLAPTWTIAVLIATRKGPDQPAQNDRPLPPVIDV